MTHVCKDMGIIVCISKRITLVHLCSAAQFLPWHSKELLFQEEDAIKCLGTYDSVLQQVYKLPFRPQRRECWQPGLFSSAVMMVQLAQRLLGLFPRVYKSPGASYSIMWVSDLGLPMLL